MNPSINGPFGSFGLKLNKTEANFGVSKKWAFLGLLVAVIFGALMCHGAGALTIQQKVEAFGLNGCYINGAFIAKPATIKVGDLNSYTDLFSGNYTGEMRMVQNSRSGYNSFSVDCKTLLGTYVLPDRGLPTGRIAAEDEVVKKDLLTKMGYEQEISGDICYHFPLSVDAVDSYARNIHYNYKSQSICAASDDTPASRANLYLTETADDDYSNLVPGYPNPVKINIERDGVKVKVIRKLWSKSFKYNNNATFGALIAAIKSYLIEIYGNEPVVIESINEDVGKTEWTYAYDIAANIGPFPAEDTFAAEWTTGTGVSNALRALNQLYEVNNLSELELTAEEKKTLYADYLKNHYKLEIKMKDEVLAVDAAAANYEELTNSSSGKSCWMRASVDDEVNASSTNVSVEGGYINTTKGWRVLAGELGADVVCDEEVFARTSSGVNPEGVGKDKGSCVGSGAAKSLGWVLCPALDLMTNAVKSMYDDYIREALRIEPKLFLGDKTGTNYTLNAWTFFRGIANIAFIVLLLMVILSQITGVGIDNYGIKRILPKLIIMAVLVNLSYYLCVVMVDLSNIIGRDIQNLFDSISVALPDSIGVNATTVPLDGVGTGMTAVGILVLIVGFGAVVINPAILVSLLVSAAGVLISILFLFILLSIREAAIVVLTVISPVAFACYILPNTKKIFDVWLKGGQGLLLVYPICGLMVGGGNYVSRLLLSVGGVDGGFFIAFAAMVIGIAPIFFIPALLKNSFVALGNIGAKISGIGEKVRTGTDRRIRSSEPYKGLQERGMRRKTRITAGVDAKGREKELSGFGRLMRGGRRNIARSRLRHLQNLETRRREDDVMETGFAANVAGIEAKVDAQRDANAEAMLNYGKVFYEVEDENGKRHARAVNPGSVSSVSAYHVTALKKYHNATTEEGRVNALAEVRAAQKILSRTDGGRGEVQRNLTNAVIDGYGSGTRAAATHLQNNFGDIYKAKNRGANKLITDLASGVSEREITSSAGKGSYELAGADKYDQASLVGADDLALKGMANAVDRIQRRMTSGQEVSDEEKTQAEQVRNTAAKAIEMYNAGRISIKPEALTYIESIAGMKAEKVGGGASTVGSVRGTESGKAAMGETLREGETVSPRREGAD